MTFVILRADGSVERWRDGDESGWTSTGLRDSRFQTLLQLGPRVFGLSRGGTVYELDDSLHEVTGDWSVSSGARWSAMGADRRRQRPRASVTRTVSSGCGRSPITHRSVRRSLAHAGRCLRRRGSGRRPTRVVSLGADDNQLKTWTVTPTGLQPSGTFALGRQRHVGRVPLRRPTRSRSAKWNGAVQLLDADTLTLRSDFGSNGTQVVAHGARSRRSSRSVTRTNGGFATVGLDGWVVRLTGALRLFSTRRAGREPPRWPLRSIATPG